MAARKGIKKKVIDMLDADPTKQYTGRELENMYVMFGGSVFPDNHGRRGFRGRVSQDTMRAFVRSLPLVMVSPGPSTGIFKRFTLEATFQYSPPKVKP
jgi:phage protein U